MKIVIQRCLNASVSVHNKIVGKIDHGIVVLVGFTTGDNENDIEYLANKLINLRIFNDEDGKMNRSLIDINGEILSISQFTLYADTKKGNRPSYGNALDAKQADILYQKWNQALKEKIKTVETGIFGADMQVSLINDGPVTIIIESRNENEKRLS